MDISKIDTKKVIVTTLVIVLAGYVLWDISLRVVGNFRLQGYAIAVNEMVRQAKNENCEPFSLFTEEEQVHLINIECLQQEAEMGEPEMMIEEE